MSPGFQYYVRQLWNVTQQAQASGLRTTDIFGPYNSFHNSKDLKFLANKSSVEIMCHPGHPGESFVREVDALLSSDQIIKGFDVHLINYNQL